MIARRFGLAVLVVACALVGVLGFAGEPALAAYVHKYEAQIAGAGTMIVNGGDLLVNEGSRLAEYNASSDVPAGELPASKVALAGFGFTGIAGSSLGIAVGHATGETELYVGTGSTETVGVLGVGACGTLECATLQGEWSGADTPNGSFVKNGSETEGTIGGVAVDNSSSVADWAKGDVFVSTFNIYGNDPNVDVVDVFKPEAGGKEEYVTQLNSASVGGESFVPHTIGTAEAVAVSEVNGDVMVVNNAATVDVFEPTGVGEYVLARRISGPHENVAFSGIRGVAVAGGSGTGAGDIFVLASEGVYEFSPTGEFLDRITGTPSGAFNHPGPVAVDPASGRVFVGDSAIDVFGGILVIPDTVMEGVANAKYQSQQGTWSLDLTGSVNPYGAGVATCRFVWGSTPALGNEASCEGPGESAADPVANGTSPVGVHARISGLAPDATYYYRLQAFNENGANEGEEAQDQSFTTSGPGIHEESTLNVTSTSATLNAAIDPDNAPTTYYFQYGTSTTYGESVPLPPGVALGSGKGDLGVSVHVQGLTAGTVYHYRVVAVSETGGEVVTVDGVDETFTTQAAGGGSALPDGRMWEMVSPPDKHGAMILPILADQGVIQASVKGDAITYATSAPTEAEPQGSTNDLQAFSTRGPDGWSSRGIAIPHEGATGASVGQGQEYRAFSEDLSLAVVQPFGSFDPSVSVEASEQTPYLRTNYLDGNVNDPCVESCYRPLVTGKPRFANVPEGTIFGESKSCPPKLICGPHFITTTPDLRHIFFEASAVLTDEKGGGIGREGGRLYEWAGGRLKVTSQAEMPSQRVLTSQDGSWVYFFSGEDLYVRHGNVTKLVAVLSAEDQRDHVHSPLNIALNVTTMRVSPDGRWLAFMSLRKLTGYDNRDAVSGKPDEEVYLYNAEGNGGAGSLVCASCDPTGARPVGVEYTSISDKLVGGDRVWDEHQWIAANIPGWTPMTLSIALYQSRYLADSGRLFFNSSDALMPQDVNGTEDVYEYEPPGIGGCTTSSLTFSVRSGGCVDLISSGASAEESGFLDASGTGGDVFFLTEAKLSSRDYDNSIDIYDAHECTSAEPCYPAAAAVPPACDTEASCRAAPTPQPGTFFGSPSSATFSGAGNLTQSAGPRVVKAKSLTRAQELQRALRICHAKKSKSGRAVCKRKAKMRYAARRSSTTTMKKGRG
jgi:WD40-like Beta Propeller Repeat